MSRIRILPAFLLFLGLAGCAAPPDSIYVKDSSRAGSATSVPLGTNAVGEECGQQEAAGPSADIFCGDWKEPSAHIRAGGAATDGALEGLATAGPWRSGIDQRFVCDAPAATSILGGQKALQMQCTSRVGGWPYVALVAQANGQAWYADGVLSSVPIMYRAIGILSGLVKPSDDTPSSAALALLAGRMATTAVKSGDIGQFDNLINAATWSNRGDAQSSAEAGLRGALQLQEKMLLPNKNDPHTATTLMALALLLSDEGKYAEADALFARAAILAPQSPDPNAQAILLYYRGLDAKNRGNLQQSLDLLTQADAAYVQRVQQTSPEALRDTAGTGPRLLSLYGPGRSVSIASRDLAVSPGSQASQSALLGLIEVRRNRALVLRALGRLDESDSAVASATGLARTNGFNAGLTQDMVRADLYRASAMTAAVSGKPTVALADLRASSVAFGRALPGSKSHADTDLLRAQELMRTGQPDAALAVCQGAVKSLMLLKVGTRPSLLGPCLDAYGDAIAAHPDQRQQLIAEMFIAAQLVQEDITRAQIAKATSVFQENIRDPQAGAALRAGEDARTKLEGLYRQREALAAATTAGATAATAQQDELDKQIAETLDTMTAKDQELQARSSNSSQLFQLFVPISDVFAVLHPNEAFVAIVLGDHDGWVFALRDGKSEVQKIDGGLPRIAELVRRVRTSVAMTKDNGPRRPFDTAAAAEIYQAVLASSEKLLAGADSLIVAPSGPLLSIPFGLLLTGPAPDDLAQAPWLIQRMAVAHVPAPVNFVGLRKVTGSSAASRQWAGFGDPLPITQAEALASFPADSCGALARRLAGLGKLSGTVNELKDVGAVFGAGSDAQTTGAAFTGPAVLKAPLDQFRILHFATHAILPTDIACLDEPAIVTSPVAKATNASSALITASQISGLHLDAEVAILSACNTGGPGGTTAGESLSGLARSFFAAGTRALLVTHWLASDGVTPAIVYRTMKLYQTNQADGLSAALAGAQRSLLAEATGDNAALAHPAYWAVMALIGAGTTVGPSPVAALSGVSASGL